MSIKTQTVTRDEEVIESMTCDACGVTVDPGGDGMIEAQEWLQWRMRGGYGSIFGDKAGISLDLCQKCIKERLGDVLKIGPSWLEQAEPTE